MKIFLMLILMGGVSKEIHKDKVGPSPLPKEIGLFTPGGMREIDGNFEFRPYRLHPSRNFLKMTRNVKTSKDFIQAISFTREYGDIIYDSKEKKIMVPNVAFNSYCEINFWKEIYPELKTAREKVKNLARRTRDKDVQREITRIKEEFHQRYLEKRIQVMEELGNEELKSQAQESYQKYMEYKARRE